MTIENITRWKLQGVNLEAGSFMIFDNLYQKTNVYHLSDFALNNKLELSDVVVSGHLVYMVAASAKVIELNLLSKEVKFLRKSEYIKIRKGD